MRQIKPPGGIPSELSSVFRHVYDEIQKLAQSINNPADNEKMDRTGGKSGDIRLVKDRANNTYAIDGRFDEGWIRFNVGEGIALNENRVPLPPMVTSGSSTLSTIQSMFPPITFLSANVPVGSVSSLPIEPLGSDGLLSANDIITVASINGYVTSFTVNADVLAAATSISVVPKTIGQILTSGSGVYLTQKSLTTWISQLEYAISIGAAVDPRDIITRVNSPTATLDKGTTVTPTGGFTVTVVGTTATITRVNGSFITDGVVAGGEIEINGSVLIAASVGATTMTATGTVTAGSYPSYIVGRTSVPVDPLPIQLRGDLGWKVIITNLEDGTEYLCELTATANAGATSISIKGKILPVKDNSPVRLDQMSLISYINISADAIDLRSLFLAGTIYLGDLSTAYNGTVTSLSLKTPFLRVPIKANDIVFIVDNTNPELVSTHTVTSDTPALNTTIPINSSTVSKPIDSKVYLTANSSSALLRITGDSITSAVQRYNANNAICQLSSGVNGTVTSLPISGLTVNLYNGDQFFVYNAVTLAPTAIQLTADVTSGATSLPVQSVTLNVPSGSGVHLRSSYARSQIKQTADSVVTSVEKFSVAGSLGVLSAAYSGTGSPFSLTLSAPGLPYAMVTGDRIYVVDKVTGESTTLQLTADAALNAISVSVTKVGGGSFTASSGSGVHVDTALVRSTLTQTATSITSVIQTSSTGNAIATLTSAANSTVITLQVTALPISLASGQKLYVVNNSNGIAYPVTVNTAANAGATSLSIQFTNVIAPIGSGLNLNTGDYGSKLSQTIDGFALTATNLYGNIYLGTLGTSYSGSTSSLNLDQLLYPVKNGNVLYIVNTANPKSYISVTATQDKAASNSLTNLTISTTSVTANSGSPVYLGPTGSSSSLKVLNDQISLAVTQGNLGSSLTIYADSIQTNTPILKSYNYVPGSTGWAIKGDGSAEFDNILARGTIETGDNINYYTYMGSNGLFYSRYNGAFTIGPIRTVTVDSGTLYTTGYWDDGQGGLNPVRFYEKNTYVNPVANQIGTIKEFYGYKSYIPTFTAPNSNKIAGSSGFTVTYDPDNSQILYDGTTVIKQATGLIARVFMGTAIPSTIADTRKGDIYLRIDYSIPIYQLYIKNADGGGTSVWTLIGP
jgi:hypothetical protein